MRCLECGKEFEGLRGTAKFCSVACKSSFHRGVSVSGEGVISVSEVSLSVSEKVSVSDDDVGKPAAVLDLVKDLHLNLGKDLGVTGWSEDGIFLRSDITVDRVQNIARLVHASHGRLCPEFLECR